MRLFGCETQVDRIALNWNQVQEYKPPPNFTKVKDSRAKDYIAKYRKESWELDALEPKVLRDLISNRVLAVRDEDLYQDTLQQQSEYTLALNKVAKDWHKL